MTSSVTNTIGKASIEKKTGSDQNGSSTDLSITSPRLKSGFQFTGKMKQTKNDYSDYLIQDELGAETKLSSSFDRAEAQGGLSLEYVFQNLSWNFDHEFNLGPTPFASSYTKLSQSVQLNHQLTEVQFEIGQGQVEQPLNYFTDLKTGTRKQRRTSLDLRTYSTSVEQVLHKRIRGQLQVELNEKSDRPTSFGISMKSAVAISDRDFLYFDLVRRSETRDDRLQDERGYFDLNSGEIKYSRYLTYDFTLSAGYGLVVEKEDNPQIFRKEQIAIDVYSINLDYQGVQWSAGIKIQELVSNVEYQSSLYGGQFSWNL
ncbi:MAG: hypothetical protein ACK5P5_05545 [Pseudobdellovibrionaceae bacterium]